MKYECDVEGCHVELEQHEILGHLRANHLRLCFEGPIVKREMQIDQAYDSFFVHHCRVIYSCVGERWGNETLRFTLWPLTDTEAKVRCACYLDNGTRIREAISGTTGQGEAMYWYGNIRNLVRNNRILVTWDLED